MASECECFGDSGLCGSTHRGQDGYERCDLCGGFLPGQGFRIRPLFEPCDLWVGFFWDRAKRRLYILPLPMIGVMVQFPPRPL